MAFSATWGGAAAAVNKVVSQREVIERMTIVANSATAYTRTREITTHRVIPFTAAEVDAGITEAIAISDVTEAWAEPLNDAGAYAVNYTVEIFGDWEKET